MNRAILEGNLAVEPEIREFAQSGSRLLRLVVVTNERTESGEQYGTSFHHVDVWNDLSRQVEAMDFHKGDRVAVDGRIEYGNYMKDGIRMNTTNIRANVVNRVVYESVQ